MRRRRMNWVAPLLLLAAPGLVAQAPTPGAGHENAATPSRGCDFAGVRGVVWWGTQREMPVGRLIAYLAPAFWFSPDEPSLKRTRGLDIRVPEPLPGESVPDRPVVYYQVDRVLHKGDIEASAVQRGSAGPASDVIELDKVSVLVVSYFAYFVFEEGLGAHPHDLEPVELRVAVIPSTWKGFEEWVPGGAHCTAPTWVIAVTRVTGKAHGLVWFWNVLETDADTHFPIDMLVEEGKHALAPDKNGDGVFTPGYDVNVRINDAWGTRDIIRTGMLFTGGYQTWMTKVRRPEHRVLPPLPDDSPLLPELRRATAGVQNAIYELRPLPPASIAGNDAALAHMIADKIVPNAPEETGAHDVEGIAKALEEGAVIKSLSIAVRADGHLGLSWVFPFFVVKHFQDPMTGGYILQRMYLTDHGRDFGWVALYTPSASRWIDTYLSAGAELDRSQDQLGNQTSKWDFVFETGLKFRVNFAYAPKPIRTLRLLTPYWGLRMGIKNRGFFDINQLSYVIELGAGSF